MAGFLLSMVERMGGREGDSFGLFKDIFSIASAHAGILLRQRNMQLDKFCDLLGITNQFFSY